VEHQNGIKFVKTLTFFIVIGAQTLLFGVGIGVSWATINGRVSNLETATCAIKTDILELKKADKEFEDSKIYDKEGIDELRYNLKAMMEKNGLKYIEIKK